MSSLGFFIERDYAASHALRRSRKGLSSVISAEPLRPARGGRPTSARLHLALGVVLILAAAFAFPEKASDVLHSLAALL